MRSSFIATYALFEKFDFEILTILRTVSNLDSDNALFFTFNLNQNGI